MIFEKIFLFLVISSFSSEQLENQKIQVIGKAMNAKQGAIVISDNDKGVFYLDGLANWDEKIYGKKVKVTGKLLIKEWKKKYDDEIRAEIEEPQKIIKRPKWILVD